MWISVFERRGGGGRAFTSVDFTSVDFPTSIRIPVHEELLQPSLFPGLTPLTPLTPLPGSHTSLPLFSPLPSSLPPCYSPSCCSPPCYSSPPPY